jgi:hypothetical protein
MCNILVRVHLAVVNYLEGMQVSTRVIANIDMVWASFYDSSCDVTKFTLIVASDRER